MLLTIIRKEVHQNLLTFRFLVSAMITIVLVTLGTYVASEDFNLRLQSYRTKVRENQNALRTVNVYSYLQPNLVRPPEPLGILDQGYDTKLGTDVNIALYRIPNQATGAYRGNEYMSVFRGLDLTTIVKVVLGLLALLLMFDAVSGEKEDGTLKLALSNSVSRATLLLGKYFGGLVTLFVPLFLSLIIGLLIILFQADVNLGGSDWARIGGVFLSYLGYLSLMLLLGLFISMVAHRASVSLVICLFVWLASVFILPNAATSYSSTALAGETSEQTINSQVNRLAQERDRVIGEQRDPWLDSRNGYVPLLTRSQGYSTIVMRFGTPRYYDKAAQHYAFRSEQDLNYAQKIFSVRQQYDAQLREASGVEAGLSYASPAYILERLANSFAGTSINDYDRFLNATRNYRNQFITYLQSKNALSSWRWFTDDPSNTRGWIEQLGFNPETINEQNLGQVMMSASPDRMTQLFGAPGELDINPDRVLDLSDLPSFIYTSPGVGEIVARSAVDLGLILGLNLLLFAASFVLFLRYDVR
jgi:ABC-type transport system involved in multi-copper enzyme maturation permease subunit